MSGRRDEGEESGEMCQEQHTQHTHADRENTQRAAWASLEFSNQGEGLVTLDSSPRVKRLTGPAPHLALDQQPRGEARRCSARPEQARSSSGQWKPAPSQSRAVGKADIELTGKTGWSSQDTRGQACRLHIHMCAYECVPAKEARGGHSLRRQHQEQEYIF
nr:hypothetical protein HJG59_009338 [Molossus molossus]